MPGSVRHWSLTTLRDKLIKIGEDLPAKGRSLVPNTGVEDQTWANGGGTLVRMVVPSVLEMVELAR